MVDGNMNSALPSVQTRKLGIPAARKSYNHHVIAVLLNSVVEQVIFVALVFFSMLIVP